MDIAERVKAIIADQLMVDIKQVTDSASLTDLGGGCGCCSNIIWLVMEFEDEFNLKIPAQDAEKLTTVLDAVTYLERRRKDRILSLVCLRTEELALLWVGWHATARMPKKQKDKVEQVAARLRSHSRGPI